MPSDEVDQGDIPLRLMQTSLRYRLSRMLHGRHNKDERKEIGLRDFSLSATAAIKLGTRRSPPPRLQTHSAREPTPTHATRTTRNIREYKKNTFFFMQKGT